MATKFLRKIIMEELQKVLKEEMFGGSVPIPLNQKGLVEFLQEKSFEDESFANLIMKLKSTSDEDTKKLAQMLYPEKDLPTYTTTQYLEKIKAAMVETQDLIMKRMEKEPETGVWRKSTSHQKANETEAEKVANQDKYTDILKKQLGTVDVPPEEEKGVASPQAPVYSITAEGKWGYRCKNAVRAQAKARDIINLRGAGFERKSLLLSRLKDNLMGTTTVSMINASIQKNGLGETFSVDKQGAKKACSDTEIVPQAIKMMDKLAASEIANAIGQESTQVAAADTGSQIAESKSLENKILRELAKMLNK